MSALELPEIEISLPRGVDWQEYAACTGRLELFFGKVAERPQARERREAKARALCDTCVVRLPCRQFAREHREYGYWGDDREFVSGDAVSTQRFDPQSRQWSVIDQRIVVRRSAELVAAVVSAAAELSVLLGHTAARSDGRRSTPVVSR